MGDRENKRLQGGRERTVEEGGDFSNKGAEMISAAPTSEDFDPGDTSVSAPASEDKDSAE